MARKFNAHDLDFLKGKIETLGGLDTGHGPGLIGGDFLNLDAVPEQVMKDIGKVEFDFENSTVSSEHIYGIVGTILGWQVHENGLPFLGVTAGGDWEMPVFFIIYWDGKKLRGYVPTDGNAWNTDTKKAYGNADENEDGINMKKRWPDVFDEHEADELETDSCPDCDPELILADIASRIQPRS